MPNGEPEVIDTTEASALLQVHRATVARLAREGRLPAARKVGREWRFRRSALLRWIEEGRTGLDD